MSVEHGHEGHGHEGDQPSPEECVDFLERIVRLIDNELEEGDCAIVRAHLDTCNPGLERYDLQRTVKQLIARSCTESAPESLRDRVRIQLREVEIRFTEGTA